MKNLNTKYFWVVLVTFFNCSCGPDLITEATSILHNGEIVTMDSTSASVDFIAVSDDKILYTGPSSHMARYQGPATKMVDLEGHTILPGLIDAHCHPALIAMFDGLVDMGGFNNSNPEQAWQNLRDAIAATPEGKWVIGFGIDPMLLEGFVPKLRDELDEIAPKHPVLLIAQSIHTIWVNSMAYQQVGVEENVKNPSASSYYARYDDGRLNGVVMEQAAMAPFLMQFLMQSDISGKYSGVLKDLAKAGFTSVSTLGDVISKEQFETIKTMSDHVRQFHYIRFDNMEVLPEKIENGDDFFKVLGVKFWYDGSPYTGSMYLSEPYLINELTKKLHIPPGTVGEPVLPYPVYVDLLTKVKDQGWQIATHSQGDLSSRQVVNAFNHLYQGNSSPKRHRLEHCVFLPENILDTLALLNMTPSFHINHLYYYGDALKNNLLGESRTEKILPLRTAIDAGLHPTVHSDSPMYPFEPFRLAQTAVERRTNQGTVIGPDQRISAYEALEMLTTNAAWQIHMEDKIGSITAGKYADFTIVDQNPLKAKDLSKIKVIQTYLAGLPVKTD